MTAAGTKISQPGQAARLWWLSLQQDGSWRGNRAALAKLRRASCVSAMGEDQTFVLFEAIGYRHDESRRLPRVATLACLLAHVRDDDEREEFGRAIGRSKLSDADSAVLKPLRFQNLLAARGEEEILQAFRRAVAILGGKADVADLARIVLFFDRDETRRDLAFAYYGAGIARPDAPAP